MRQEGTRWVCERCGKEAFTESETDKLPNGKEMTISKMPEGWGRTNGEEELCQSCYEKYIKLRNDFFNRK